MQSFLAYGIFMHVVSFHILVQAVQYTYVKIIKNEVILRCRDDTVPKTVDTRQHCKVGLRACNNLPQPRKTKM